MRTLRSRISESADVFVAGGGPAGLATAIAARRRGFRVTLADADSPPIDKACGEGLLPATVQALSRLGVELPATEGYPLQGIRFFDEAGSPCAGFPTQQGRGVRRKALHERMVDHASKCGVRLLWRTRVTGLDPGAVVLDGIRIRARWIVGADGGNSLVRRWSGLNHPTESRTRVAYRQHYRVRPWTDYVEVHWGKRMQAYVTPVGREEVCVAVISQDSQLRVNEALCAFPALAERVSQARLSSAERGGVTSMLKLRRICRGRVALVGDAAGCVDAITGEGLGLAFQQAEALADALAANDLRQYETTQRKLIGRASLMAKFLLALNDWPALRGRVMRTLAANPHIFARLLASHVGESNSVDFFAAGALLGWHLLAA